ncbi:MAG: sugar ABC transporter permease [Chloroflexi bacterium HGW-Chloroflexi-1]|nr:MAG: sugar ABC transporter permease [Chloroflexi bacterium HGW-Chloroflexi-1]
MMINSGRRGWSGRLLRIPVLILAFTMVVPYYWMLTGAFKSVPELLKNPPTFYVARPTLNNFYDPLGNRPPDHIEGLFQRLTGAPLRFGTYYLNSLFISTTITILSLILASAAAYVLAKHRFPGRDLFFLFFVASMMVPWQVTIIPNFLTMKYLGWINTYWALLVPALPKAFVVFFLRQYMLSLPDELLDAARIDGAGEVRIWWQIVLPLVGPALTAMSIFVVLNEWNNFVWPLIIVQDAAHGTLPLALSQLSSTLSGPTTMGVMMAAALLVSLPTLLMFTLFQRQFIRGIALSGLKG